MLKERRGETLGIGTALLLITLGACVSLTGGPAAGSSPEEHLTFSGRVASVVDGDTFWISSESKRVRVWGLHAPETNELGGSAATATLSGLISQRELSCRERDIDRFGRVIGQCFLPDGRDITAVMISSGTAR